MKTRQSNKSSTKQSKSPVEVISHRRLNSLPKIHVNDPQTFTHEDKDHCCHLLSKLQNGREHGNLVDVTLDIHGEKIFAHKIVLATAIPYFQGMFTSGFKEGEQETIKLQDLNAESVVSIVDYVYSGRISITGDNCSSLLETANFLQVDGVKDACSQFLQDKISVDNCVEIFMAADMFGCVSLTETAKNYIVRHFKEVDVRGDLVHLSQSLFQEVISAECLNFERDGNVPNAAECEKNILTTVIAYVRHRQEERIGHLPSLLSRIKLPSLSPETLAEFAEMDVIQNSPKSSQLISTAQKWQKPRETKMSRGFSFNFRELEALRNTAIKKSPNFQFHNRTWSIRLQPKYFDGKKFLGLFLGPEMTPHEDFDWFTTVEVYFELRSHFPNCSSISENFVNHYDRHSTGRGFARFVEWSQLQHPNCGFIADGKLDILVKLKARLA